MSEKRGEVIVPAGRRYQQKQHELLPAAKGLNFYNHAPVVSNIVLQIPPDRGYACVVGATGRALVRGVPV